MTTIAIEAFDFNQAQELDLGFDVALDQAVTNWGDEAASALVAVFDKVRSEGDFDRLAQMAMVLGATACVHDHLQELSTDITKSFSSEETANKKTDDSSEHHNAHTCKNCKNGKFCKHSKYKFL